MKDISHSCISSKNSIRKIHYVPGLISALLVPVLFWYYITPYIDFAITNVIDLQLPSKDKNANIHQEENTIENYLPRNWNDYSKIIVSGNEAKKNSNLYVSEIRKLSNQNSENKGIEFVLDENSTYGDFVSLLNDFHISKHEYYGIDLESGNLVASKNPQLQSSFNEEFECLLCNDHIVVDEEEQSLLRLVLDYITLPRYSTFFEDFSKLPSGAYIIIFSLLLFLNISMLSIKERFQLS